MEYLFKLKEDGKTVGYLKIQGGIIQGSFDCLDWHYITKQNPAGDLLLSNDQWIHFFDTAHPFVTKSKNGKDVFADDEIKMFSKQYKIVWDERELGWFLQEEYKAKIKLSHTNKNHIELIENEKI